MVPFWPKGSSTQMVVKAERDEQLNMSFSYVETSSFLLQTVMLFIVILLELVCKFYILQVPSYSSGCPGD